MKKYFTLVAIASLVISISSCKEDEPEFEKDLTESIVGTYAGTLSFGTDVFTGESVTISKQSNRRILIQPADDPAIFYADLSEQDGGLKLTVKSQVTTGIGIPGGSVTITGNSSLTPGDPTEHGAYLSSGQTMHYSVVLTFPSSTVLNSEFAGTKQ